MFKLWTIVGEEHSRQRKQQNSGGKWPWCISDTERTARRTEGLGKGGAISWDEQGTRHGGPRCNGTTSLDYTGGRGDGNATTPEVYFGDKILGISWWGGCKMWGKWMTEGWLRVFARVNGCLQKMQSWGVGTGKMWFGRRKRNVPFCTC